MMDNKDQDRDTVLIAFHEECELPTRADVERWSQLHPRFAKDIRDHAAIRVAMFAEADGTSAEVDDVMHARSRSRLLDAMYNARREVEAGNSVQQTFDQLASKASVSQSEVAKALSLKRVVVASLFAGRMLNPLKRFRDAIANVLRITTDQVRRGLYDCGGPADTGRSCEGAWATRRESAGIRGDHPFVWNGRGADPLLAGTGLMDAWSDIRLAARRCRADAVAAASGAQDAKSVIDGMIDLHDLELDEFVSGTSVEANVLGWFERAPKIVHVAKGQPDEERAVVIAHEFGHFILHSEPTTDVTDVSMLLSGEPVESGAARVDGYSSRERKELQADVFAGEFLCPTDWLKGQLTGGTTASVIAKALGLPYGLVLQQAIRALLLPPLRPPPVQPPGVATYQLDGDQKAAASWNEGPLLVHAGPGTGKTRTLIERIRRILVDAQADSILALTFSNKAAEEMRERLSQADPAAAIEMWVGTFHAFGLELVTRFAGRIDRSERVAILDPTAALALLEANLERLPLRHYQNLFEPAFELVHVLGAISRAKDELIGPAEYLAAARADFAGAGNDAAAVETAEKAIEIGLVYEIYERLLMESDSVDFGDLIVHAVTLLEDPVVRADVLGRFKHILVDEYQDVNYASSMLLRSLARDCSDVWVVADHRQSIYRFRGAEPSNVARFPREFGGKTLSLGINYRSGTPVVRTFAAFTGGMQGGAASSWNANRGDLGEVTLEVCPTLDDEACAIRDRIEALRTAGVPYRDQAILARSHLTLGRLTGLLERLGVPLLYLGDLFERGEIRDSPVADRDRRRVRRHWARARRAAAGIWRDRRRCAGGHRRHRGRRDDRRYSSARTRD